MKQIRLSDTDITMQMLKDAWQGNIQRVEVFTDKGWNISFDVNIKGRYDEHKRATFIDENELGIIGINNKLYPVYGNEADIQCNFDDGYTYEEYVLCLDRAEILDFFSVFDTFDEDRFCLEYD